MQCACSLSTSGPITTSSYPGPSSTSSPPSPPTFPGPPVGTGGTRKVGRNAELDSNQPEFCLACRRFDSKNCTAHGGLMANEDDCVFPKDVTIDVWKKLNETAANAKMPSDEFFQ